MLEGIIVGEKLLIGSLFFLCDVTGKISQLCIQHFFFCLNLSNYLYHGFVIRSYDMRQGHLVCI